MKLSQLLVPELVIHPLQVRDKWAAIEAMTRAAVAAGRLPETLFDDVHRALVLREKSMTTGMEHGVAIPHAAVDRLDDVVAVFAIAPDGVPFESLDGQPARILVGLIIPRAKKLLHIKTLAEIAKLLSRETVRTALLAAGGPDEVVAAVRRFET